MLSLQIFPTLTEIYLTYFAITQQSGTFPIIFQTKTVTQFSEQDPAIIDSGAALLLRITHPSVLAHERS